MKEAQIFGTDLIAYVLAQEQITTDFKKLILKTLDDKAVKDETIHLLEYILKQKQSEEILAKYLNTVFLRPDVLENLTTLLTASASYAISDEDTKEMFQNFVL